MNDRFRGLRQTALLIYSLNRVPVTGAVHGAVIGILLTVNKRAYLTVAAFGLVTAVNQKSF